MYVVNMNPPTQHTYKGLQLFLKLLSNLLNDPYNEKFRKIYLTNETIKNKLLSIDGVLEFLLELGFTEFYENNNLPGYEYREFNFNKLNHAIFILKQEIDSFQVWEEGDPKMKEIVESRKKQYEEEKAYKQKLIRDFEANKRFVF